MSAHAMASPVPAAAQELRRLDAVSVKAPPWLRFGVEAVLRSYAQVLFSRSAALGAILMAATFVVPSVGAIGLLGVALSSALALVMRMDREAVREGLLGYNALLVFLAIGATLDRSPAFFVLAGVTAMLVVVAKVVEPSPSS